MADIEELNLLLEKTAKLYFPAFTNESKKQKILIDQRDYMIGTIKKILKKFDVKKNVDFDDLWNKAEADAKKEFTNLPGKLQLNSFYYQEVMHNFIQNCTDAIVEG